MKWNWGYGIATLYLGFVVMMLCLVVMSMGKRVDLVTDQYYEEELKFSDKMEKKKRARALAEQVDWSVSDHEVAIRFPESITGTPSGKISFYCPSNSDNDRSFAITSGEHSMVIPVSQLPAGRYQMQIDWASGGQTYWDEGVVVIQ